MAAEQSGSMQDLRSGDAPASFFARAGRLLAAYHEPVQALQQDSLGIAFAEMSLHQTGMLAAMRVSASMLAAHEAQMQRLVVLTGAWLKLAAEIQAGLLHAWSVSLAAPALGMAEPTGRPAAERRSKSVVINFPDRRSAA